MRRRPENRPEIRDAVEEFCEVTCDGNTAWRLRECLRTGPATLARLQDRVADMSYATFRISRARCFCWRNISQPATITPIATARTMIVASALMSGRSPTRTRE